MNDFARFSRDQLRSARDCWAKAVPVGDASSLCPELAALLVVAMRNDFLLPDGLVPVWSGPVTLSELNRLIDLFRGAPRPIAFTRHSYERREVGGATVRFWGADASSQLLREGAWHVELHSDLQREAGDPVLSKGRYNGCYGTDLELLLRTEGVRQVVVTASAPTLAAKRRPTTRSYATATSTSRWAAPARRPTSAPYAASRSPTGSSSRWDDIAHGSSPHRAAGK